jgi:hypothetical protein
MGAAGVCDRLARHYASAEQPEAVLFGIVVQIVECSHFFWMALPINFEGRWQVSRIVTAPSHWDLVTTNN